MLSIFQRFILTGLFCGITGLSPVAADPDGENGITIAELRDHMYFLSSDYLGGRVTGTQGFQIAANYAASQFLAAGLQPVLHDARGTETFFQEVPLKRSGYLPGSRLVVRREAGSDGLESNVDFKMISAADIEALGKPRKMVFVGYGIEEPDSGWNDFDGLDVKGKWVIALAAPPGASASPSMPRKVILKYQGQEGWERKHQTIAGKNPLAIIYLIDGEKSLESLPNTLDAKTLHLADTEVSDTAADQIGALVVPADRAHVFFQGQVYFPAGPQASGPESYVTFELKEVEAEVEAEPFTEELVCHNVLGMVEGRDRQWKDEYVVVTAHLDHIPPVNREICNGADDNASGSAAVMEIAEAVAADPPRRSVLFVLFTGEDFGEGRMGSKYFISHCPVAPDKIVADINLDMIGRDDAYWPEGQGFFVMDRETPNPDFHALIETANERTLGLPISFHSNKGGASDSMSFSDAGIPAIGFFTGAHEDLHTPEDEIEKIVFHKVRDFARLACVLALDLADPDIVPKGSLR